MSITSFSEIVVTVPKVRVAFLFAELPPNFHSAWYACWIFRQTRSTNISIGFVSLGLENQKKFVPLFFYWPAFTFPWHGFSKTCWVRFPQLQNTNVYRIHFPRLWEPTQTCVLWTQTNFDLGLLWLSLVSQNLVGFVSLSFMAPIFIWDYFPAMRAY